MMIIIVKFQFTHPRGVRRGFFCALIFFLSFNSRTREGCDYIFSAAQVHQGVSIHAPARGATRGGRLEPDYYLVSIHAPARGATACACVYPPRRRRFNSRTREGCD